MTNETPDLLSFHPAWFERVWGGTRLRDSLGHGVPGGVTVGEAWLVSDHAECESIVDGGPWDGRSLREIMLHTPRWLLGNTVHPTPDGRFPLLLKLIDSAEALSVQVHPDDETAARLGEKDVGKTEMWHVLESGPGGELICGLKPEVAREDFSNALAGSGVAGLMCRFAAPAGTSVFVPAGTVHAIGADMLIAEIQQNSNITYRVYDWDRVDARGCGRTLHVNQALESIHFGEEHGGPSVSRVLEESSVATRRLLSACRYFTAEEIVCHGGYDREKGKDSFHLVLSCSGDLAVRTEKTALSLQRGQATLVPGHVGSYSLDGNGKTLVYYISAPES